ARALEDVLQVAGETVGGVDRRMGEAAQALAELDARLGLVQALGKLGELRGFLRMAERERRAAELARDPDIVSGAGSVAVERDAGGHLADRDDADGQDLGPR